MALIADLDLTVKPTTALYTNIIPDVDFTVNEADTEGRKGIVLDFGSSPGLYSRDIGTILSWPLISETAIFVWQPTVIEQPESIYGRPTDWLGNDRPGAKFIQGVLLEANSFNQAKTLQLQSGDDLSYVSLYESPATFNQQSEKAFSCSPFIAHTVRVVPSNDGVPFQLFGASLISQPYPELMTLWSTELLNFGLGWQHVRMLNIPYIASAPVTITLEFDQWPTIVLTDVMPATASQLYPTKLKVECPTNKSKLVGFQLQSTSPFRVFREQLEVWVGVWGRRGTYIPARPFGGESGTGLIIPSEYRAEIQ